ncbi:MAG TPA: hypothetical protein VGG06_06945 [Thermoanaerobaculia bacterium]|jgi:Arc/MetJ-type ribon-helix-helix transcriptional regulator
MSDDDRDLEQDEQVEHSLAGDYVEIDWEPLQAAIDAMADEGLDVDDSEVVRDHLAVLLASLLRRMQAEGDLTEDELAEAAAQVAELAVLIALGDEEVPEFAPTQEE